MCWLGSNGRVGGNFTTGKAQPFCGQMGGFYFFQEPLGDSDVRALAEISPKSFANFNPGSVGSPGDPKLASKLLFAYSPKVNTKTKILISSRL